jgi:hypothetical protein
MIETARVLPAYVIRLAVMSLVLVTSARSAGAATDPVVDYSRDVRPILSQHCFKCHGVDDKARKGKLRLDERESALKAGKSGELSIVPGKPDESELVRRILTDDEDEVMPPTSLKVKLTEQQKQTLKRWVAQGAEYKPHWAFAVPATGTAASCQAGRLGAEPDRRVRARPAGEGKAQASRPRRTSKRSSGGCTST